ncbi:LytTR family transcriptional regulator DNA-binding domain-containing protein, partial [uncultured Oscillibacter sp.]|uniref:LytTR family transcriptional regulator DNA-binding domain-containing protein n=1 Tax=uncultured Oscillibacter sp. TaxID=876091 RepID=UPI0025CCE036
ARTYTFYGKLDDVERDVGDGFVRVHQRYLIRAGAVDRMEGTQVFVGDAAIPVSRACRSAALAALARSSLEG